MNIPYEATLGWREEIDWGLVGTGVVLLLVTVVLLFLLKRVVENVVSGIIAFLLVKFLLGVDIPLLPAAVAAVVLGAGGVGLILILHVLGLL